MTWDVLVAAIVTFVIGALWYGPLFGKQWMKLTGMTKAKMKKGKDKIPMLYLGGFIATLITAYALSVVLRYSGVSMMTEGVEITFWVWLGFIGAISFGGMLWENKPFSLWILNNCYYLLTLIVMTAILVAW